jgi:hypothetical protein
MRSIEMNQPALTLTAWWTNASGEQVHVHNLLREPALRKTLPLLDQLALELELVNAGLAEPVRADGSANIVMKHLNINDQGVEEDGGQIHPR